MPSLSQHQSNDFTKLLIEGDSGSGKSGSLTSLVKAGYKLRILDFDNGLEPLKQFVLRDCPDKIDNVEFRTLRDEYTSSASGPKVTRPTAFVDALKMLDHWKYGDVDLGKPSAFGPDCIVVIDSLTFFADAAFEWARGMLPSAKDPRQWYGAAQEGVESALALLTSDNFRSNVIVISHVKYVDNPDGTRKGYPTAVGSALSPVIPRYFNSVALCQTKAGGARTIQTTATAMIDLKNPKPFAMAPSYPIETGLADFFGVLREPPTQTKPIQPKLATIRK
ncbi:MAG: AAA family ATPase [Patescibacteria group bacterium]|nr:AAA family ATPase [Patescibacteria group bacterium]